MANCITRHIPNAVTCCNLFSGCIASVMAFNEDYTLACLLYTSRCVSETGRFQPVTDYSYHPSSTKASNKMRLAVQSIYNRDTEDVYKRQVQYIPTKHWISSPTFPSNLFGE